MYTMAFFCWLLLTHCLQALNRYLIVAQAFPLQQARQRICSGIQAGKTLFWTPSLQAQASLAPGKPLSSPWQA